MIRWFEWWFVLTEVEANPELLILTSQINQFLMGTQDDVLAGGDTAKKKEKEETEAEERKKAEVKTGGARPTSPVEDAYQPAEKSWAEEFSDSRETTPLVDRDTMIMRPTTLELECRSQPGPIADVPKVATTLFIHVWGIICGIICGIIWEILHIWDSWNLSGDCLLDE